MTSQSQLESVARRIVEGADSPHRLSGVVIAVVRGGRVAESIALGVDAIGVRVDASSVFPLGSTTKLATSLAVLRLVDRGALGLDDELGRYVPDALAARPGVTLRRLLSHTSGLPLEVSEAVAPYDEHLSWPVYARGCRETPLLTKPGERVQYSNAAYGLIGQIVEKITDRPFKEELRSLVLSRCNGEYWFGEEPSRAPAVIADIRSRYVGTPLEYANTALWRGFGFPSFSLTTTALGLIELARAFMRNEPDWIRPELLAEATRSQTGGLFGGWCEGDFLGYDFSGVATWADCSWGLGPEVRGTKAPHWTSQRASVRSFGHVGSTGCLVWVDPDADVAWAVMGTRTTDSGWLLRHGPAISVAVLGGSTSGEAVLVK
jgi:CubicO group peptidase (beta-lactamase class C family)